MPEVGDKAPPFKAKNQNGTMVSLRSFKGKKVILYFYPEDDTPTCTEEACNLRDNFSLLKKKGFEVVGVSPDEVVSHKKFEKKFGLPFPLLSDPGKKIINDYGAWGEKQMFGHRYQGVYRYTFIINEKGIIERIFRKVHSKKHTQQILDSYAG